MDYDIFEDLPEKREKWVLKDKKDILSGQEVITFCLYDNKLALLVNSEQKLSIEIIDFFEGLLVTSITIRSPGLPKNKKVCDNFFYSFYEHESFTSTNKLHVYPRR